MCPICVFHCTLNPKEWHDDLEISRSWVKTKVIAFHMLDSFLEVMGADYASFPLILWLIFFLAIIYSYWLENA